jgi:hypothetical protein
MHLPSWARDEEGLQANARSEGSGVRATGTSSEPTMFLGQMKILVPDDDLFICRLPQELKSHLHAQELHELLENLEPGLLMSKSTSEMKLEFLSNGQI